MGKVEKMLFIQKHKYACLYSIIFLMMVFACSFAWAEIAADKSAAVIFSYQRVGEDSLPQSSVTVEQFKAHIKELTSEGYQVLPLPQVIDALQKGTALPPRTVVLTFDGAWLSTLNNAIPLLEDENLPFTIFFASDMADAGNPAHMSWKQLRRLQKDKLVTFGIFPSAYASMAGMSPETASATINKAVSRFREELGSDPAYFAYPYGEYSSSLRQDLQKYSFKAAFGQQSGVAHAKSDLFALPRFTLTGAYGDFDRFLLTVHAKPLPVSDVMPEDMVLTQNPPLIGFTVTPEITDLSKLSCFVSGKGKVELARLGDNRIEIRLSEPFDDRGTRVNCTMPDDDAVPGQPQNWRWFGMQLTDKSFSADDGNEGDDSGE